MRFPIVDIPFVMLINPSSPIDFNNAFMAFMGSAAMYLRSITFEYLKHKLLWTYSINAGRDTSKVIEAAKIYRSGGDSKEALRLLESSTASIDALVRTTILIMQKAIDNPLQRLIGRYVGHALHPDLWLVLSFLLHMLFLTTMCRSCNGNETLFIRRWAINRDFD